MRGSTFGGASGCYSRGRVARRHRSAASLYMAQTRLFSRIKGTIEQKHEMMAKAAKVDLYRLTSGPVPESTLRAMGHPYGRGARRMRLGPSPINKQSGRLRSGIYLRSMGKNRLRLGSTAPHAKYQFSPYGTHKMIRRGVMGGRAISRNLPMGEIERRWRARLKGVRQALKAAGRS